MITYQGEDLSDRAKTAEAATLLSSDTNNPRERFQSCLMPGHNNPTSQNDRVSRKNIGGFDHC